MKLSFRTKLAIIVTLLTVSLSTTGMLIIYHRSYVDMMERMNKNLVDVGRLGSILFDNKESIRAIRRLKQETEKGMRLSREEILAISPGEYRSSLPPKTIDHLHASADFQMLVRKLSLIQVSTLHDFEIDPDLLRPEELLQNFKKGMVGAILMTTVKGVPVEEVFVYLVSVGYESVPGLWPGNPIGNIGKSLSSPEQTAKLWAGKTLVNHDLVADDFYACVIGFIPLRDESGNVIAVLEIDYPTGSELDKLAQLRFLSFAIVAVSSFLGLLLSVYISKRMTLSLDKLRDAAVCIEGGDYGFAVDIEGNDEFAQVGTSFNRMTSAICRTMKALGESNNRLRSVTADMHDGVGAILASIKIMTRPQGNDEASHVHKLSSQGLDEVRFLMDALEYDNCDLDLLCEGLDILAADILKPRRINGKIIKSIGDNRGIPFKFYLDVQRIVREALTNTLKHSTADECVVEIGLSGNKMSLIIFDNGHQLTESLTQGNGRGLENIRHRVAKYQGHVDVRREERGFCLTVELTVPPG